MASEFDAVVIGAGPGGETVASRLLGGGLRVALVERELIGGSVPSGRVSPPKRCCVHPRPALRRPRRPDCPRTRTGRLFGTTATT
jgi:flavin-dependent dehydrogenase